ncbi:lipid phosphate phosphatase epsilon 1, chloroplastic [Cynara cardunculus var. scolymus]|uniref:Phosphatidic acid phosphatase/chloroperoxidase, N-terminal n=1 Tax=Cynara cardunculus var. scolymus TaxID=59895 RepID=A0A103Y5D0_CYNCS|nr:lipid phosphate phosphatase epsilon 1, chloroplastic [Cynara cardunculus var. scolymus]KVI02831.1 Phosphatidic acid phosphatase/chloroperoxidase, N-terminal [Cynara cardunculus var. scolymus]
MSPATVAIFINPPPLFNLFHSIHRKPLFSSPAFRTLKQSAIVYRKSISVKKPMAAESIETGIGGDERISPAVSAFEQEVLIDNGGVSFHQTAGGLHTILNSLSRWIVAATFGGVLLLRHDAFAFWAALGSVLNAILSITLKQVLKQERPVPDVSSGHGMPSSHAQSIFFATVLVIFSVVEWHGFNGVTAFFSVLVIALGSYFSWLRVLLCYHTTSQVVVGAIVGSIFSVLWFWAWEAMVHKAYNSNLWVRVLVTVGATCFCLGFISHVFQHWIKSEH